jgi:hypothetical protein
MKEHATHANELKYEIIPSKANIRRSRISSLESTSIFSITPDIAASSPKEKKKLSSDTFGVHA